VIPRIGTSELDPSRRRSREIAAASADIHRGDSRPLGAFESDTRTWDSSGARPGDAPLRLRRHRSGDQLKATLERAGAERGIERVPQDPPVVVRRPASKPARSSEESSSAQPGTDVRHTPTRLDRRLTIAFQADSTEPDAMDHPHDHAHPIVAMSVARPSL